MPDHPSGLGRRRSRAELIVAAAAIVAAVVTLPTSRPAAADVVQETVDLATDAPARVGPFRQHLGYGAYLDYTITYGEDARVGPDASGDGWYVHAAERLNKIYFYGVTPSGSANRHVELYVDATKVSQYDPAICNCAGTSVHGMTWTGRNGGDLAARITFNGNDTGLVRLRTGCTCAVGQVRSAAEIENQPPRSAVIFTTSGHRSDPEHLQEFHAAMYDANGHNLEWARLEIYEPDGDLWTEYEWPKQKSASPPPPNQDVVVGPYPLGLLTPPLPLPHENGTYTLKVQAKDTSGRPNATGPVTTGTFEYTWNLAPVDATQVVPRPEVSTQDPIENVFPAGVPVAFVSKAVDPENDPVTMVTKINDGPKEYRSVPTASGREAVTLVDDGLPFVNDREQYATVSGEDLPHGARGLFEDRVFFRTINPAAAVNDAPETPTLIAPVAGGSFGEGAPQDFVIRTTDFNGDAYRGVIEVHDANGTPVAHFATDQVPSGKTATGRPLRPIPAGEGYQWRATALDSGGRLSQPSAWRSFSVGGDSSSGTVFSDDCAAGTTVAQITAGGHYAHVQTSGNDLCFRIDGPALGAGGKLTVTFSGAGAPPVATVDDDTDGCTTDVLAGSIGDPSDPATYLPYRVSTFTGTGRAALCVDLGNQHRRIDQQFPGGSGEPAIAPFFDPPGGQSHTIAATPGLPSSLCSNQPGSTTHLAGTAGPAIAHLRSWWETPTRLHVCVRSQWATGVGAPSAGGRLTIDTTASAGVTPSFALGDFDASCSLSVVDMSAPAKVEIRRSSTANPASVCLNLAGSRQRLTVGVATGVSPPSPPTWTPDPGSPGAA